MSRFPSPLFLLFAPLLIALAGCGVAPLSERVLTMEVSDVCIGYAENRKAKERTKTQQLVAEWVFSQPAYMPEYEKELNNRGFFTDEELDLIKNRTLKIGAREEILTCLYGRPDAINRSVSQYGVTKQYVFRNYGTYVYTENGVIRSFQD